MTQPDSTNTISAFGGVAFISFSSEPLRTNEGLSLGRLRHGPPLRLVRLALAV